MKTCPRCGLTKPSPAFAANRCRPDGLQGWCRFCQSAYNEQLPLRRSQRPLHAPSTRGRPYAPKHTRKLQGAPAETVIAALLRYTLWPVQEIAHMARCSTRTVYRISQRHNLTGRPSWQRRTVYRLDNPRSLSRKVFYRLLDQAAQNKVLTSETIINAVYKEVPVAIQDNVSTRKRLHAQLKGARPRAAHRRATNLSEEISDPTMEAIKRLTDQELATLLLFNIFSAVLSRPENQTPQHPG